MTNIVKFDVGEVFGAKSAQLKRIGLTHSTHIGRWRRFQSPFYGYLWRSCV